METVVTAPDIDPANARDPETSAMQTHGSQQLEPKEDKTEEQAMPSTEVAQPTEQPSQ